MMKSLLRSVVDMDTEGMDQEVLTHNFRRLRDSHIEWEDPQDEMIYKYIKEYNEKFLELPSMISVRDYFGPNGRDDTEVLERLKTIAAAEVYKRTNFSNLLQKTINNQTRLKAEKILNQASEIITKGLVIKEGKEARTLKGVKDSLLYFQEHCAPLLAAEDGTKREGNIRKDGQDVWDAYIESKTDKSKAYGKFTGLKVIDDLFQGAKKGDLHIHAGYASDGKTTMALNWAYNLVTKYRTNVFYASFEMKYKHLRTVLYVMHSANSKWEGRHPPLDYKKVRDGSLTPKEEAFFEEVIKDFTENPEYCDFHIWEPDHDVPMNEVRFKAEILNKQSELGFIVLDHGGLMEARKSKKNDNYTVELNSVLRDAKKLALQFNGGEGIPVLMLFQINRAGRVEAEKNDGIYKMNALSYANEAERSADVVTATFLDENLKREGLIRFSCLKGRDDGCFEPFNARIDFTCRRLKNITEAFNGMNTTDESENIGILDV